MTQTATHDELVSLITREPTAVPGLKWFPSLEPHVSNDQDGPHRAHWGEMSPHEVTDCNLQVVRDAVALLGTELRAALEIGVNRNGDRSMSRVIMDQRPAGSVYLGVDIEDKSYLNRAEDQTWTMQCSSSDRAAITARLQSLGVQQLDLIMIDGWHSVNQCVNDWHFSELLSDHGVVLLHDTNWHPGCVALWDAVDETQWIKTRHCMVYDFGIATFRKRKS